MYFNLNFLQRIYRIGVWLIVILLLADLLSFFFYSDNTLGKIFLATREKTPLTWLSSLALFFIALSCFSIYFKKKEKIWYFLAAIFFFFSVDDAIYLHERLSGIISDIGFFSFFPSYTWVILYAPLLLFSLGAFIYLLWRDDSGKNRKPIVIALVFLGLAIFLDFLDGLVQKNPSIVFCLKENCNLITIHLMRLAEEIIEVLALGVLGYVNIKEHCLLKDKKNDCIKKEI